MKGRIVMAVVVLIVGVVLAACVKTPDEKVVVDKSEGLAKEVIIPKDDKAPKDLGIPKHWQETIDKKDGFVILNADYEMGIPDIYNTPVYSYERKHMTDELLNQLCDYFSEGDRLYEPLAMTKSELNEEKDKFLNYRGRWQRYADADMRTIASKVMANLDELIEKAPENEGERKYIDVALTAPYQAEKEYATGQWRYKAWHAWYYDTDEKVGFTARIDRGREVNPVIRAIDFNDKVGSTTGFVFSQGTFIDENKLKEDWVYQHAFQRQMEGYLTYLTDKMEQTVDGTFSKEDALEEVEKILKDLSIEGLAVTDCVKAIGTTNSESWGELDEEGLPLSAGYSIYLAPKAGDFLGYPLPFIYLDTDLPETMYVPTFLTEQLNIIITKEGVQRFEWVDISRKKDTIAENTQLLPFDKIKDILADHMFYAELAALGETEGYHIVYTVKNVQFRMANINAYEDPSAAWLVPVWVFEMDCARNYQTADKLLEGKPRPELIVLNAIDGGYVTMNFE